VLGVERGSDKKEIKRAYFALASTFHPDRFFGKKLGHVRAPLVRVFIRLTEASDALSTNARREAYDATLPPMPAPPPKQPSAARRMSKRIRKSLLTAAVVVDKPIPAPVVTEKPIEPAQVSAAPISAPPICAADSAEKFRRLQATAQTMAGATKAQTWITAAEDSIRAGDIVGAANNYRLALQMHNDPAIRQKLEAIDAQSRDLRHEKYLVRARGAERAERWEDAADNYVRANEARKEASCAERGAYTLRISKGDLRLAATLGEQAVAHDGKNVEYRVTLGEVYFASGFAVRAKEESEAALALAPTNPRAKALAAAIRERS